MGIVKLHEGNKHTPATPKKDAKETRRRLELLVKAGLARSVVATILDQVKSSAVEFADKKLARTERRGLRAEAAADKPVKTVGGTDADLKEYVRDCMDAMDRGLATSDRLAEEFKEYTKDRFDGIDRQFADLRRDTDEQFADLRRHTDNQIEGLKESINWLRSDLKESNARTDRTLGRVLWSLVAAAIAGTLAFVAKSVFELLQ